MTIYMRADVVMLGLMSGDSTAGIYAAAARFSEVWYFLPMSALAAIRPRLARLFAQRDLARYQAVTQQFMTTAFAVSIAAVTVTLLLGNRLILLSYGPLFSDAGMVLEIHVLAAPFVFLGVAASQWFIDRGLTKELLIRTAVGAGSNIAINLALIPTYGAIGAAIATLISYALSSMLLNAVSKTTRPVFVMQLRACRFVWRNR